MGKWLNIRCPTCGWLHSIKKWLKVDPRAVHRNFGLEFSSQGYRNISNEPLGLFDDIQLEAIYRKRISPRVLFLATLFYDMGLISVYQVRQAFSGLFKEARILGNVSMRSKPSLLNFGVRYMKDYVNGGDLEL